MSGIPQCRTAGSSFPVARHSKPAAPAKASPEALFAAAERAGITVAYETRATGLVMNDGVVTGVKAKANGKPFDIAAKRVILACGGFEANTEWRTRYLGPSWELAKVRGSRFNTGDGLRMALDIGAAPFGNWSGCHSASWDLNAPDVNELAYGTVFKRDDYLYGRGWSMPTANALSTRARTYAASLTHASAGSFLRSRVRLRGRSTMQRRRISSTANIAPAAPHVIPPMRCPHS